MVVEFITNHVFMCSILLFGLLSVFMQWMMTMSLKSYVKASANMKTTRKKIMINLKNQFETIYGMDYQVRNIEAYVDKYLLKLRFLGFSYSFWEKIPFLSMGLVTLIAVGTAFYTYSNTPGSPVMMEILFSYGVVLVCLFLFFHIFGIKSKKQQIQIQLVDYLENYLTNRVIRNRESEKEMKILDETMEEALIQNAASCDELESFDLEQKEEEKEDEMQAEKSRDSEADIQMLLKLVKEMERGSAKRNLLEKETDRDLLRRKLLEKETDRDLLRRNLLEKETDCDLLRRNFLEKETERDLLRRNLLEKETEHDLLRQKQNLLNQEIESGLAKQFLLENEKKSDLAKQSLFEKDMQEQIAAAEDATSENGGVHQKMLQKEDEMAEDKSDIELLEEFVQSFLA